MSGRTVISDFTTKLINYAFTHTFSGALTEAPFNLSEAGRERFN